MGLQNLNGMRDLLAFDAALEWHLRYNLYPPVSSYFKDLAIEAIAAAKDGDWDKELHFHRGPHNTGEDVATVRQVMDSLYLEGFLDDTEEP